MWLRTDLEALPIDDLKRRFDSFVASHESRVRAFVSEYVASGCAAEDLSFSVVSMDCVNEWMVRRYRPGAPKSHLSSAAMAFADPWWVLSSDPDYSTNEELRTAAALAGAYVAEVIFRDVPGLEYAMVVDGPYAHLQMPLVGSLSFESRLQSGALLAKSDGDVGRRAMSEWYVADFREGLVRTVASAPGFVLDANEPASDVGPEVVFEDGFVLIKHDLLADLSRLDRFRSLLYERFGDVEYEESEMVAFEVDDAEDVLRDVIARLWVASKP